MSKKNEIVYILDRSGSMANLTSDTIGGFNSMIQRQRAERMDAVVTVALFNNQVEIPFDSIPLEKVPKMTDKIYFAQGCTALYDAVGTLIKKTRDARDKLPRADRPAKTIFVITTDGLENASRTYNASDIKRMIAAREEEGWEFLYLGANIDAIMEAGKIGIRAERSVRYCADREGVRKNFEAISDATVCCCAAPSAAIPDNWKERIEEDYKRRGRK